MSATTSSTFQGRSLPPGFGGVRGSILVDLKRAGRLTTRELASRLGTSLNAIRHHLKELERQGLVEYERQYHGVGAPSFAYRITEAGEALFPRRYESTLFSLLDDLLRTRGRADTVAMLEARYTKLAEQLRGELSGATPGERLEAVSRLLTADGFMAEVSTDGSTETLTEHNCAILDLAERFPEICAAEARLLSHVLGAQVHRERHILNGCRACEYRVRFGAGDEPGSFAATPQENS